MGTRDGEWLQTVLISVGIGLGQALVSPTGAAESLDVTRFGRLVQSLDNRAHLRVGIVLVQNVDIDRVQSHLTQTCLDVLMDGGRCDAPFERYRGVVRDFAQDPHVSAPALTPGPLA